MEKRGQAGLQEGGLDQHHARKQTAAEGGSRKPCSAVHLRHVVIEWPGAGCSWMRMVLQTYRLRDHIIHGSAIPPGTPVSRVSMTCTPSGATM